MIPRSRAARLPSAALIGIALLSGMGLVVGDSHAGATWRVDPDGGGDALTIAGGVALASEGDTIRIAAATYPETIAIEKGISFIGVGGDVIWQGNGTASCLSIQNSAPFRLEGIIFEGGGGTEGGGLDARNVYGGFTVVACTFRDMTVTGTAAGIYTLQTSPLIADSCVFSNLEATGSLSGGVLSGGNGGTFRGCEFLNCTGIRGGGLSVAGEGNLIENCTFDGCEANFAGALNLYGADDTTVRGCTFSGNRANYTGGAIDLEGTGHLIENSRFSENTAPASGGAINAFNGSGNTVRANLFFGNSSGKGGAICEQSALQDIVGNTFDGNTGGQGAAIGGYSGSPSIEENIFSNQTGFAIDCSAMVASIGCNDFWQNSAGNGNNCAIAPEEGNIFLDPLFCEVVTRNFAIHSDSPCTATHVPAGCGRMGAFGVGCGDTPTLPVTWGRLRALFR